MILALRRRSVIVFILLSLHLGELIIRSLLVAARIVSRVSLINLEGPTSTVVLIRDTLSLSLVWLVGGALILCYLRSCRTGYYPFLWWLTFLVLLGRFITFSILRFYILFELSLVPILLLIIIQGTQPERLRAGMYFLIYTSSASVPYLLVVIIFFKRNWLLCPNRALINLRLRLLLVFPFLVKMPILGVHFWLPKAHVEARTRGSIVLAGLLLKLGRYGVSRVVLIISCYSTLSSLSGWLIISLLASVITLLQSDIKKLVAYRSVTHITFILIGLVGNNKLLVLVVLIISLSHGWCSISMFHSAGTSSHIRQSRLGYCINMETTITWTTIVIGGSLLVNASVPPFPSFFAEAGRILVLFLFNKIIWGVFIVLSFIVCYYNTFFFLWLSHTKRVHISRGSINLTEGSVLALLLRRRTISLLWLILLFK